MEKRKNNWFLSLLFLILMTADSYAGGWTFFFGGFEVYYHLPIFATMIFLGILTFLVNTRIARGEVIGRQTWIILLPLLFPLLWSSALWIIQTAEVSEIRRGIVGASYPALGILAMAASVYAMGGAAPWAYLLSLILANGAIDFSVAAEGGFAPFFQEFLQLILTFAKETGPLMRKVEVHGITYGIGVFLILFLWDWRTIGKHWLLFFCTVLFFLLGLKRIAVAAVGFSVLCGWGLLALKKHSNVVHAFLKIIGTLFLFFALAYVGGVYFGLYDYMEKIGIDTNYRATIYRFYTPYFQFSPTFLGNGTGWVDNIFREWQIAAAGRPGMEVYHTHNDYLRVFIELGMPGFLIWTYLKCNFQVSQAYKKLGERGGILCVALVAYMAVSYMTDPISTSIHANNSFAVILLAYGLEQREEEREQVLEEENRRRSEFPYMV